MKVEMKGFNDEFHLVQRKQNNYIMHETKELPHSYSLMTIDLRKCCGCWGAAKGKVRGILLGFWSYSVSFIYLFTCYCLVEFYLMKAIVSFGVSMRETYICFFLCGSEWCQRPLLQIYPIQIDRLVKSCVSYKLPFFGLNQCPLFLFIQVPSILSFIPFFLSSIHTHIDRQSL